MRANGLRSRKAAGQPIINAWLSIGSSYLAEIISHGGCHAVTVDCQHGMIGFETAVTMLQAISTTSAIPLVRVSRCDPAEIMRFLDAGAYGLICPMISTRADAEKFVAASRYPPAGIRSFGPARGLLYGGADYARRANDEILTLAMIETTEGLANLDSIIATPGLDGIYVGPNDLALALGSAIKPESDDAVVIKAVERIRSAVKTADKMVGIFCSDGTAAAARLRQGFDLVTPGNDAMMLKAAIAEAYTQSSSGMIGDD